MSRANLFDILSTPELAQIIRDAPHGWRLPARTRNRYERTSAAASLLATGGLTGSTIGEMKAFPAIEQDRIDRVRQERAQRERRRELERADRRIWEARKQRRRAERRLHHARRAAA